MTKIPMTEFKINPDAEKNFSKIYEEAYELDVTI